MTENNKIFVWQWGRFGAGPRFAFDFSRALLEYSQDRPLLSISRNSEIYQNDECAKYVDLPVETYQNSRELMLRMATFPRLLRQVEMFVGEHKPLIALCIMANYSDFFVVRHLQKLGLRVVTIVHDQRSHPGDNFRILMMLQKRQISLSDHVVALSDFVRSGLIKKELVNEETCSLIPLPVFQFPDLKIPPPEYCDYSGQRPLRLLMIGRLKTYKGVAGFTSALSKLGNKVEARIVGQPGKGVRIGKTVALENCRLDLRWQTELELIANIDWADIVVLPYDEASQSGIIPLSFSRARPVITTNVGGLPEQVEHNINGLILKKSEPVDIGIEKGVMRFIDDVDFYRSCSRQALAHARNVISWKAVIPRFVDMFDKCNRVYKSR